MLVYAALEPASDRGRRATQIILDIAHVGLIAAQCLGEFLNVIRRRSPEHFELGMRQVRAWSSVFTTAPTDDEVIDAAAELADRHHIQFWDAVVLAASQKAGADLLLSEEMQDGGTLGGVTILNPFSAANDSRLKARITP